MAKLTEDDISACVTTLAALHARNVWPTTLTVDHTETLRHVYATLVDTCRDCIMADVTTWKGVGQLVAHANATGHGCPLGAARDETAG